MPLVGSWVHSDDIEDGDQAGTSEVVHLRHGVPRSWRGIVVASYGINSGGPPTGTSEVPPEPGGHSQSW